MSTSQGTKAKLFPTFIIFIELLLAVPCARATELRYIDAYQEGKRYALGPITVLVLKGSYLQMGQQYGHLMQHELAASYQNLSTTFNGVEYKWLTNYASRFRYRNAPQVLEILQGMAHTSKLDSSDKRSFKKLTLIDHALQMSALAKRLSAGCTFISAWGTSTLEGANLIGRNFDWAKRFAPLFMPYPVVAIFKPSNGDKAIASVGYVGWISAISGISEKGLSISLNSGAYSTGSLADPSKASYFAQLTQAMFKANDFDELVQMLLATKPDSGYITNVGSPKGSASIETTPPIILKFKHQKAFARVRYHNTPTYLRQVEKENTLVATNTFHLAGWENNFRLAKLLHITPYPEPGSTPSLSFMRYENMNHALNAHNKPLTVTDFKALLERPIQAQGATEYDDNPYFNYESTYYSLVIDSKNLNLWIRFIENQTSPWYELKLKPLFDA